MTADGPKAIRYYKIDRENIEMISHTLEHLANLFSEHEGYESLAEDVQKLRVEILHRYIVQGDRV